MAAGKTGNSDEKFSCCINPILREGQAFLTIVIVIFSIHQQTLDRFGYTGVGLSNKCGNNKQLLDEVFVISRIIKVENKGYHPKPKAEADNPCRDLDYAGCHKNLIQ